jgi:UDP-N-acetyl-2-amino-2-deoxyglucuronate dehydrogenase
MSSSETTGFAILGSGMIAEYHCKAIAANADLGATLVAIVHYNQNRFTEISNKFKVPCLTLKELLDRPEVNVICICTPSGQHADQTMAAAKARKHIIVEKPMALNLNDSDAMIQACNQAGVKLGVALQRRTSPLFQNIYKTIHSGDLGELTLGVVTLPYFRPQSYYDQAEWRGTWALDGGGVLMNQGIHIVDLLVWYMGDPLSINAYAGTNHHNIEVEDTLTATLSFKNNALATITATTSAEPGFPHRIEIYGTKGAIQVEGESIVRWELADPSKAVVDKPQIGKTADAGAGADPRGISAEGHIAIFKDFIHAIRDNREPLVNGFEGRRSLSAVLGIYQAAGLL